jgi:tetratricopeptide (TPR) repeat protein
VHSGDGRTIFTAQSAIVASTGLLQAIDDVVERTRRRLGRPPGTDASPRPLPDYTTASLPALRLYAGGLQAAARQDFVGAIDSYRQAVTIDSTFALAWTALGRALALANRPLEADGAFAAALRHARHLTDREQMIVRAAALRARGFPDSAIDVRGAWIGAHPDDVEQMRTQLYDLLTRSRRVEAVALGEALTRRDSTDENVLYNLALAYDGDDPATRRRAVATYARALRLDPTQRRNPMLPQLFGGLLARAQMYDSAASFLQSFAPVDVRLHGRAMRALGQMELMRGQPLAAVVPFERAIAAGRALGDTLSWVRARLWLANTLYEVGDTVRARAHVDTLLREAAWLHEPPVQYWIGVLLARVGRLDDADAVLRALERASVPTSRVHSADRVLLAAEIATGRGQARRVLPTLAEAMRGDSSAISLETLAWTSLQAGDTLAARTWGRAIFERTPGFGFEGWLARDRARAWMDRLGADERR